MTTTTLRTRTSRHAIRVLCSTALITTLGACGDRPQPKPPAPSTPVTAAPLVATPTSPPAASADPASFPLSGPDDPGDRFQAGGISGPKPVSWTWQQPSMQFRTLQYSVPGDGASVGAAEFIVSVFGAGDGGPLESNIARWAGQFRGPDGAAVEPKRSEREVNGLKVLLVDLEGTYSGMGGAGAKKDFMQRSAIIDGPAGRVFLRLLGPKDIVNGESEAWDALIAGLKKA